MRLRLFISIAIIAVVALIIMAVVLESNRSVEELDLRNGQTLKIERSNWNWRYFGLPHQGGIGGGRISHSIAFQHDGRNWEFDAPYDPIVLQPDKDQFFMVVFDRDTDAGKGRFRFYRIRHMSEPEAIPASDFPKQLAVQNTRLRRNNGFVNMPGGKTRVIDEYEIAARLDPSDEEFRDSLTARLWQRLELGQEYYATEGENADQAFLEDYKKKYISERK